MNKYLQGLTIIFFLSALISCSKTSVTPDKVVTKITDTTKTPVIPPPTLPAGVATTFAANSTSWLAAMHSDEVSTAVAAGVRNTLVTDATGNIYVLFNYYGTLDIDPGANVVANASYAFSKATLAKYSPAGKLLWSKQFDSDGSTYAGELGLDQVGNVFCSMRCDDNDTFLKFDQFSYTMKKASGSGVIFKFNPSGTMQWLNEIGSKNGIGTGVSSVDDIGVDALGNTYAVGSFDQGDLMFYGATSNTLSHPANVNGLYYLVKYDANGGYVSSKTLLNSAGSNNNTLVTIDKDQNVYVTGFISGPQPIPASVKVIGNLSTGSPFIAKYDKNGNWLWLKINFSIGYTNLKTDANGYLYAAGNNLGASSDELLKIDGSGNDAWNKTVSTQLFKGPRTLSINNSGEVLTGGDYNLSPNSIGTQNHGIYLNKYAADGSLIYAKKFAGNNPLQYASMYSAQFDNAGNVDMIGFFNDALIFFGNSSDPVYALTDFKTSFFMAHFPDKP